LSFETLVGRLREGLARKLSFAAKVLLTAWVASFGGLDKWPTLFAVTGVGAMIGIGLLVASFISSMRLGTKRALVTASGGRLAVNGRDVGDVTNALARALPNGWTRIECSTASDLYTVDVMTYDHAAAVVAELGFAPGQRAVTYRLASRFRRFFHLIVGYGAYQIGSVFASVLAIALLGLEDTMNPPFLLARALGVPLVMLPIFVLGKRLIRAPVIRVGSDGVRIESAGFPGRRFVPYDAIAGVSQLAAGTPIALRAPNGTHVPIVGFAIDASRRDVLARHVHAMIVARSAQGPHVRLGREGRTVAAWRAHIKTLVDGGGYRVAASNESLGDLVGRTGLPLDERVGAALALRVAGTPGASARIRVAAEQCVDPKARAALEAVAAEEVDEAALDRALARRRSART
jgi:hypothetical protein